MCYESQVPVGLEVERYLPGNGRHRNSRSRNVSADLKSTAVVYGAFLPLFRASLWYAVGGENPWCVTILQWSLHAGPRIS